LPRPFARLSAWPLRQAFCRAPYPALCQALFDTPFATPSAKFFAMPFASPFAGPVAEPYARHFKTPLGTAAFSRWVFATPPN